MVPLFCVLHSTKCVPSILPVALPETRSIGTEKPLRQGPSVKPRPGSLLGGRSREAVSDFLNPDLAPLAQTLQNFALHNRLPGQGVNPSPLPPSLQPCAQVLLTQDNLANRAQYLNARNTFMELFNYGTIPIVNENDTVAVEQLRIGDNDTLAAQA
jgi:hypothetical protein